MIRDEKKKVKSIINNYSNLQKLQARLGHLYFPTYKQESWNLDVN
jgi:hypothetical protein